MLAATGRLLAVAPTANALAQVQTTTLRPLERRLLNAGSIVIARDRLVELIDDVIANVSV